MRLHLLPPRFVKIRHYGLLANRGRQQRLQRARALLKLSPVAAPATPPKPRSLPVCPHGGRPALFLVGVLPPQRLAPAAPAHLDSS